MRTVHKIVLDPTDVQLIQVYPLRKPNFEGWYEFKEQILKIEEQEGKICLWYMLDNDEFSHVEEIHLIGTGHSAEGLERDEFLGTVLLRKGFLVFHVFSHKTIVGGVV